MSFIPRQLLLPNRSWFRRAGFMNSQIRRRLQLSGKAFSLLWYVNRTDCLQKLAVLVMPSFFHQRKSNQ